MTAFHQALMLGTTHLFGALEVPHKTLLDAWSKLDAHAAPESQLLDAAALLASARAAGARPRRITTPIKSAAPDSRRIAPKAAGALLPRLFEGEMRPLLGEWLDLCAQARCVVPPYWLPRFLRHASAAERPAFASVAGERGAWLAAQNPEWSWFANPDTPPSSELWETGTPAQRIACLTSLRRGDPAEARRHLEETWKDETPEFRQAALAALETALAPEDEPFLTRCLEDRRREVRQQAQHLLATMPGSVFTRRMRERAGALLSVQRRFFSKRIELSLPDSFDAGWKADGIEEKPPAGIGEKTFWIRQILALVPVGHWTTAFEMSPADLVKSALESEWSEVLIEAWLRALPLAPEPEIAAALFEPVLVSNKTQSRAWSPTEAAWLLLRCCSAAEAWSLVARFGGERHLAWVCIPHLHTPPASAEQALAVLRHLAPLLREGSSPGGAPAAVAAARRFPPMLRDSAARLLESDTGLSRPAEAFLAALDLRAAMRAAFEAPA